MSKLTTHQRKARDLMQREDWKGALAELQRVLGMDSNNPTLHNQIGDVHLRKGDVDQACDHFEMAIDLYSNVGLHNNAVALCRKVVRLAPTRVDVRYHLARLRMDQGLHNDAAAAFVDYLDHAHPDDDQAADALEQRCVDVVETFPDMAPVGQILEKLEAVNRPQGAYRIVQRAAQRAADAGDTTAARRLTEKMRSLRVLLENTETLPENAAEELRLDVADPVHEAPESGDTTRQADTPPAASAAAASDATPPQERPRTGKVAAPAPAARERRSYTDPGAIDLPPVDDATDVSAEPQEAHVPQFELDDEDRLDAGMWTPHEVARTEDTEAARKATSASPSPHGAAERPVADPDEADSASMPEYELPETSLEEVADLLQDAGVEPTPPDADHEADAEPQVFEVPDDLPEVEVSRQAASIAETFQDPPAAAAMDAAQPAVADDDVDWPASVVYEPAPGSSSRPPSRTGSDDVRRSPVWIPSPDAMSEDPTPSEEGQTQELEEVIDTFREQMARALGDDGSARYDLGVAYYDMGLYNEALAEFEVAVKCPGLANRTLEMMASCLSQQGRHDEVVSLLAGPLAENDTPTQERLALQYAMGLALEAVGQGEDARRHFEEVALVDIGFKDVQSRLQR